MNNDYGQASERDDEEIYHRAWIYHQENQEMQNLTSVDSEITYVDLREIDRLENL